MTPHVVLEHSAIHSALGPLPQAVDKLLRGESAIHSGPFFGVPVACAPFEDQRYRDLAFAARSLGSGAGLRGRRSVLIFCCAKGDIRMLEDYLAGRSLSTGTAPYLDAQAHCAAGLLGGGFCRVMTVSNACASGAIAVEIGQEMLLEGEADQVVLFGLDTLSQFVVSGFHSLNALSPTGARPFDAARDGLTPGEGAALAVLTLREAGPSDVVVAGAGSSNDANHRTGPSRTGEGLFLAAQSALRDAEMEPGDIGAVKCHGTGTNYNDAMEAKALVSLFGQTIPPCASVKGALGHTSGAGSLLEILCAAQFLKRRVLPPTAGFRDRGVDELVPVSAETQSIVRPSILCLSAGFGGVNAAVVLREGA